MYLSVLSAAFLASSAGVFAQTYTWKNVHTGAGGGWIGNVVFNSVSHVAVLMDLLD